MTSILGRYTVRSLIPGHKIGKEFAGMTLIAVPKRRVEKGAFGAWHYKDCMVITPGMDYLHKLEFEDKFNIGGKYWLYYYEWKPEVQESLF